MKRVTHRRQRRGFTLLELMIAVGLTSLLMAAVYGAMSTYWQLSMDSQEEVERAEVSRALFKMLRTDLQSCTFLEQLEDTSADDADDDSTLEANDPGVTTSVYRNGMIGNERDLILYISRPDRDLNYVAAADAVGSVERNSDLMIVRWVLADTIGGGLGEAIAETYPRNGSGTVAGLARGSGGVTGFGQAIDQENFSLQVQSSELVSAEVENIVFEYFDGIDWRTEWNSATVNQMPQAVKIEVTLRNPEKDASTLRPTDLPSTTHRLVVPIPVAAPYIEETAI